MAPFDTTLPPTSLPTVNKKKKGEALGCERSEPPRQRAAGGPHDITSFHPVTLHSQGLYAIAPTRMATRRIATSTDFRQVAFP